MPRNGSGIYSLPQAAFVPGTTISSSAVNSDFSDIATALTDSVAADGQTPIAGQLKSAIVSNPAYSSSTDDTTGFGVPSAGTAAVWVGGAQVITSNASLTSISNTLNVGGNAIIGGSGSISGSLVVVGALTVDGGLNVGGSTGGFSVPDGTTAQRPATVSPISQIRFNSTLSGYEGFDGTEWQVMSSIPTGITLSASVNSNLLTVSVLNARTGAAPTTLDPVQINFPDATTANGDPVSVVVSSALSINTNGAGASLGSSANTAFRFWVVAFNNGGTPYLGLINCSTPTQIYPLNEAAPVSTTSISSAATSAGVFYSPNGVTLSNVCFKILGYLEYGSTGLSQAGYYTSVPSSLRLFNSSIKKPGDIFQTTYFTSTVTTTVASTVFTITSVVAPTLTPQSAANLFQVRAWGTGYGPTGSANNPFGVQIARGASLVGGGPVLAGAVVAEPTYAAAIQTETLDKPNTSSGVVYSIYLANSGGSGSAHFPGTGSGNNAIGGISVTELMG